MVQTSDVLLILVAILFPPAAAAITTGCSCDLLINVLLTVLGYLPGHIHAFWLIYKQVQAKERFGENCRYVGGGKYVPLPGAAPPQEHGRADPPPSYGAIQQ